MSGAFTDSTKAAAAKRASGRCELCGTPVAVPQFHHRRPRGMGGSRASGTSGASNCLVLHPGCHRDVESNRQRALDRGWLVSQYQSPAEIPVKRWDGLFLLADDGTLIPA